MTNNLIFLIYILGINVFTALIFYYDKAKAKNNERRVSEKDLLCLALIGGSLGALWASYVFRHKTRKQPFSTYLKLIILFQFLILIALIFDFRTIPI